MVEIELHSAEEILSYLASLTQDELEVQFRRGELCAYLIDMGFKPAEIGAEINCSASLVREQVRTYKVFPTAEDRLPYADLTFYHFRLCSKTDDPHTWAARAVDEGLSTRELARLIRGAQVVDELKEAERIAGKAQRVLDDGGRPARHLYKLLSNILGAHDVSETWEEEEEEEDSRVLGSPSSLLSVLREDGPRDTETPYRV